MGFSNMFKEYAENMTADDIHVTPAVNTDEGFILSLLETESVFFPSYKSNILGLIVFRITTSDGVVKRSVRLKIDEDSNSTTCQLQSQPYELPDDVKTQESVEVVFVPTFAMDNQLKKSLNLLPFLL